MNQNTFLELYPNNSFFQLNRKSISNSFHIIWNFYLVIYNYGILLVLVIDLIEYYLADHQMSRNIRLCYLLL